MDLGLKGLKAIVTGGSRGIGRAIAGLFADEGANVAICARTKEGVEEAKKDLEARGSKVVAEAVDVADGDALKRFVTSAVEALGGLDILVSNPTGGNGTGEKAWRANFEVDLLGAIRCVETATPALSESENGSVLFVSSTAAVETFMGPTSYNAIKAALIVHSNGLSQALAPQGIRVNTISPGSNHDRGRLLGPGQAGRARDVREHAQADPHGTDGDGRRGRASGGVPREPCGWLYHGCEPRGRRGLHQARQLLDSRALAARTWMAECQRARSWTSRALLDLVSSIAAHHPEQHQAHAVHHRREQGFFVPGGPVVQDSDVMWHWRGVLLTLACRRLWRHETAGIDSTWH